MAYLLDANVFIEAKRHYYGFDICPAFWDWIERGNAAGTVKSIDRVKGELVDYGDDLADWARRHGDEFFLPLDEASFAEMTSVAHWVQAAPHREAAKREFLAGADPFLIAYAAAHDHVVVTHEVANPQELRKVKIPVVCDGLGVPCVRTFDALRSTNASFLLRNP